MFRTVYWEDRPPSPPGERIPPNEIACFFTPEPRKETAFLDLDLNLDHFPNFSRPGFMERENGRPRVNLAETSGQGPRTSEGPREQGIGLRVVLEALDLRIPLQLSA